MSDCPSLNRDWLLDTFLYGCLIDHSRQAGKNALSYPCKKNSFYHYTSVIDTEMLHKCIYSEVCTRAGNRKLVEFGIYSAKIDVHRYLFYRYMT